MTRKKENYGESKRVRMRDVANRCGVSISTVSLVLSGDPRIPEDTTRRVLQAVKALEYRPSVVARNLARRSSRTIGVILPEFAFEKNSSYFYQALRGIHSQTQPSGYKLIVEAANRVFLERRYYHRLLKEQSADGVIYMAAESGDRFLNDMHAEPYPFVLLDCEVDNTDLPIVGPDGRRAAEIAVEHLVSLGHEKIAHLAAVLSTTAGKSRLAGYQGAMKKAGLEVDPSWVAECGSAMVVAEKEAERLANAGVTAIVAANDTMAYAAIRGCYQTDHRVPDDVSVVGLDNLPMSEWMSPAVTTVDTRIADIAALTAKFVINRVQSPLVQKDMLSDVPEPALIVRQSSGPKRA